jgi:hypothetical protein
MLLGCSSKEEKVLDIHDVLPSSEKDYEDEIPHNEQDPLAGMKEQFLSVFPEMTKLEWGNDRHFIDRFETDTTLNLILHGQEDSMVYREWKFKDSVKTQSAFFNWIDHASKGESVVIGTPYRLHDKSFQMLTNDTLIIYFEGTVVDHKKWSNYLIDRGFEEWDLIIQQTGKSKAKWYTMRDKKLEAITTNKRE